MKRKPKIDWDTAVLAGPPLSSPARTGALPSTKWVAWSPPEPLYFPRRRKSIMQRLLAGASMKARAAGARHRHAQLCRYLEPGLAVLSYGWGLAIAAIVSDRDFPRGVEIAAYVIYETSIHCIAGPVV